MNRQMKMCLGSVWCPWAGQPDFFSEVTESKQGTNRPYSISFLASVVKAVSAFPCETFPFQGLFNSAIKISSKLKLGMKSFSLRVNFFFFLQIVKGGKNQSFGYFYLFLSHKNIKQKCTVLVVHFFGTLTKTFIGHYEAWAFLEDSRFSRQMIL